jgi:CcmD family protein
MNSLAYIAAVNLVIWTGLFLYLWRLDARISEAERGAGKERGR